MARQSRSKKRKRYTSTRIAIPLEAEEAIKAFLTIPYDRKKDGARSQPRPHRSKPR
jgi:hypothetical protein